MLPLTPYGLQTGLDKANSKDGVVKMSGVYLSRVLHIVGDHQEEVVLAHKNVYGWDAEGNPVLEPQEKNSYYIKFSEGTCACGVVFRSRTGRILKDAERN